MAEPTPFHKVPDSAPKPPAANARPVGRPPGPKATKPLVELIPFPKLQETLESYYMGGSIALMPVFPATGMQVAHDAKSCATAIVEYAKASPAAHKMISRLLTGVGVGTIIAAHIGIMVAVMQEQKIPREQRMMAMMMNQPDAPGKADAA